MTDLITTFLAGFSVGAGGVVLFFLRELKNMRSTRQRYNAMIEQMVAYESGISFQ